MKKIILLVILSSLVSLTLPAQERAWDEVKICEDKPVCAVDFYLLEDILTEKHKKPKTAPLFSGGKSKLLKYFSKYKIGDSRSKDLVFRIHIAFMVNCEGRAGDFRLLDNELEGTELKLSRQVFGLMKELPQVWKPAVYKGDKVNCYQVLSLTIMNGKISTAYYHN